MKSMTNRDINKIYNNPRLAGKHVIIMGDKTYTAKSGRGKTELLRRLIRQHPKITPLITFIPKADTLIL